MYHEPELFSSLSFMLVHYNQEYPSSTLSGSQTWQLVKQCKELVRSAWDLTLPESIVPPPNQGYPGNNMLHPFKCCVPIMSTYHLKVKDYSNVMKILGYGTCNCTSRYHILNI